MSTLRSAHGVSAAVDSLMTSLRSASTSAQNSVQVRQREGAVLQAVQPLLDLLGSNSASMAYYHLSIPAMGRALDAPPSGAVDRQMIDVASEAQRTSAEALSRIVDGARRLITTTIDSRTTQLQNELDAARARIVDLEAEVEVATSERDDAFVRDDALDQLMEDFCTIQDLLENPREV